MKEFLDKYIKIGKENKDNYKIALVANVKLLSVLGEDYPSPLTSAASEFFSLDQLEEILTALRNQLGYEVALYLDENSFLESYIKSQNYYNKKKLLVLNSAQSGIASGRKSLIPAFCELNGIVHTNSDSFVSSYTRFKYHCYTFLKEGGFSVCDSYLYNYNTGWYRKRPKLNEKVIVKLNRECSSIGLSTNNIFEYTPEKDKFIHKLSKEYKQSVIIQKFISGYEVEVPTVSDGKTFKVFNPTGVGTIEPLNNDDIKYNLGDEILDYTIRGHHLFKFYDLSKLFPEVSKKIQSETEEVAKAFHLFGLGRVDYRITENGDYYITDISSNPHFTESMTFNEVYKNMGYEYKDVFATLIGLSLCREG